MYQAATYAANTLVEFIEKNDFFRILEAPQADITVIFYAEGKEVSRAENIGAGYSESFDAYFDKLAIKSTAGGEIAFVTRLGNSVRYDTPPTGVVIVTNNQGAFSQAQATVTNANGQLLAANPARRYLLVQNKDAAGIVYLNIAGAAATAGNGLQINPGGSYDLTGYLASGQINAIGSIANNPNVVVIEG